MQLLWKKFGNQFLQAIKSGTLHVKFSDGSLHTYGNKQEPVVHLTIHDNRFFKRIALFGDIGFAESYIDGDFDTDNLTGLIMIALSNSQELATLSEDAKRKRFMNLLPQFNKIKHLMRKNSKTQAQKNIASHYDLSNDFFALMLDETMMYSSALFQDRKSSLLEAQQHKIAHLAKKLRLKPGAKVLEIGSGWGAMAMHLAEEYHCDVTTVTLSKEQMNLCKIRFQKANVEKQIDILLKDYRDIEGEFDAIISIEMFEAVGKEYFDIFFKKCESLLKPSGIMVMQVITMPDNRYSVYAKSTDFIQKYIFPGGHLPSVSKILETTTQHTRLNLLHLEEFAEDYAKTLHIWHQNFSKKIPEIQKLGFDEYFIRMWKMYLNYCEAAFITRNIGLVQLVFSRDQNMYLNKGLLS